MERNRAKLSLEGLSPFSIFGYWIYFNRFQVRVMVILFFQLLAGIGLGIILCSAPVWSKMVALILFGGFLGIGLWGINLARRNELARIRRCLLGIISIKQEAQVYFDQADDELGEIGYLLNQLLDLCEQRLFKQRRLMGGISHDLRTPLTIMRGNLEVALLRERGKQEYKEVLESNLEEVNRLARLVEELLTISKAEAGDLVMRLEPVRLGQFLSELVKEYQPRAKDKGLDLTISIKNDIIINADKHWLSELFANLIENAIQYTQQAGKAEISLKQREKDAWVEVSDQGVGIPQEEIPFIFEPFYRGTQAKTMATKGYGLGLSICKQIVEAHNGTIEVESRIGPESGTIFKLRLPIR